MYGVVLPAGGVGSRMGSDRPKQFLEIQGRPIYRHALDLFINHPEISEIVFVCAQEWLEFFQKEFKDLPVKVTQGGKERWNSVYNGIQSLSSSIKGVLVHDVARPFLPQQVLDQCLAKLNQGQNFVVAKPAMDTIKLVEDGKVTSTIDRNKVWMAQTPQGGSREELLALFKKINETDLVPTDESSVYEFFDCEVHIVEGSSWNDKITTPEDLEKFKNLMER